MSADGHPFASSENLSSVDRLLSTADDAALDVILASTVVTPGGTTITTDNGFATSVRNAAGDYTLTFSSAFAFAPTVLGVVPIDTTTPASAAISGYAYSVNATTIRIKTVNDSGTAVDPNTGIHVSVIGS